MDKPTSEIRQEILTEIQKTYDLTLNQLIEKFINEIGYTESLHAASILQANVDEYLVQHPCIVLDPESFNLAYKASQILATLYQRIGLLRYEFEKKT